MFALVSTYAWHSIIIMLLWFLVIIHNRVGACALLVVALLFQRYSFGAMD